MPGQQTSKAQLPVPAFQQQLYETPPVREFSNTIEKHQLTILTAKTPAHTPSHGIEETSKPANPVRVLAIISKY